MSSLTINDLNKNFDEAHVLKNVNLDIKDGEFVVLVGPSGCGKSTLLRIIAGLEQVTTGDIKLDNELVNNIPAAERGLAMVFQSYALYPHMNVYKNMAFALENAKLPKEEIDKTVTKAAKMLRLDELLKRKPGQLSGGQRQRVAIGRAMVRNPKIFLFDEPLSNLDAELRVAMRKELATLHRSIETTMIYVTHDQTEAMTMADRIVVMRLGVIEQVGEPLEVYNNPVNKFVAGFIGSPRMNFIPATVSDNNIVLVDNTKLAIPSNVNLSNGQKIEVGIRPEHIKISNDDSGIKCKVEINEQLGGESYIYCSGNNTGQLTVHFAGQNKLKHNDEINLIFPTESLHIFDEDEKTISNS